MQRIPRFKYSQPFNQNLTNRSRFFNSRKGSSTLTKKTVSLLYNKLLSSIQTLQHVCSGYNLQQNTVYDEIDLFRRKKSSILIWKLPNNNEGKFNSENAKNN